MGLIGVTRALAAEFGDDGVTVNAICPGPVEGERIRGVFERQAEAAGVSAEAVEGEVLESPHDRRTGSARGGRRHGCPPRERGLTARHGPGHQRLVGRGLVPASAAESRLSLEDGENRDEQADTDEYPPPARRSRTDERTCSRWSSRLPVAMMSGVSSAPRRTYPSAVSVSSPRTTAARRRLGPRSPDTCRAWWSSRRR